MLSHRGTSSGQTLSAPGVTQPTCSGAVRCRVGESAGVSHRGPCPHGASRRATGDSVVILLETIAITTAPAVYPRKERDPRKKRELRGVRKPAPPSDNSSNTGFVTADTREANGHVCPRTQGLVPKCFPDPEDGPSGWLLPSVSSSIKWGEGYLHHRLVGEDSNLIIPGLSGTSPATSYGKRRHFRLELFQTALVSAKHSAQM